MIIINDLKSYMVCKLSKLADSLIFDLASWGMLDQICMCMILIYMMLVYGIGSQYKLVKLASCALVCE